MINTCINFYLSASNSNLNITEKTGQGRPGFTFVSPSGLNYGPNYGVFINDEKRERVEQFCNAGNDRDPRSQYHMDPAVNPALTFECT